MNLPFMASQPASKVLSYNDLLVWQRSMDLVEMAYRTSRTFPREEQFGLTSQLRRAVVSVPSNIAEGHGRESLGEYLHHLSIANGSLMEFETQIAISSRLGYLQADGQTRVLELSKEVGRMLAGLTRALKCRRRAC